MAEYSELYGLHNNSDLRNKVIVACLISAEAIMNELDTVDNHANRLIWAASVFDNPKSEADRMYRALIASSSDMTIAEIEGATDAAIQTKVDNHVDLFATG